MNESIYTIEKSIDNFLDNIALSRSLRTIQTYRNAMKSFTTFLSENNISINNSVMSLSEKLFDDYMKYLKSYSHATENLYVNVLKIYYDFLTASEVKNFNFLQIKFLIKRNTKKEGIRLIHFPQNDVETVIDYAVNHIPYLQTMDENQKLINLRDSAFLITLADTGLRVHEACGLCEKDIDWKSGKAIIIGKGDKEAIIRFSNRSLNSIKRYLDEVKKENGFAEVLPLFMRHDKGAGDRIEGITTKTGRIIVQQRVKECIGKDAIGTITPHSFRHYFVTNVLRKTGNLKIAQEFARHSSVSVTQRYIHLTNDELDKNYNSIFNVE